MSEPFRTRQTPTPEAPLIPGPVQPTAKPLESFSAAENPERLDVYEFEKGHKLADSYFNLREVSAGDWNVKMNLARIDKYVKSVLESKQYDSTTSNYREILSELESQVNSTKLMGKARLQRILTYINLLQKTDHIKQLKAKFFAGLDS